MRKNKMSFLNLLILLIVFLILFSSIFIVRIFRSAEDTLLAEHDRHLFDIAQSVDHSIENMTSKLNTTLNYAITSTGVLNAEYEYLRTGNVDQIFTAIENNNALTSTSVKKILLLDGDEVIASSSRNENITYTFPSGCESINVCLSSAGTVYLAFINNSTRTELKYAALVELSTFYDGLIFGTLYDEYDVMLFDRAHNVIIENIYDTPDFKILGSSGSARRKDGYNIILNSEAVGETNADVYSYVNLDNEEISSRIVVLPSTLTYNGKFAVSVSTDSRNIFQPIRQMEYRILATSIILSLSITALILSVYFSIKREKDIKDRMKQLSDEKELTEKLLLQQKELAHHQKLETIGILTSGVAHEFNNLLAPIMSNSILIIESLPPEDTATYDSALAIYDASYRDKQLVSSFSRLSRKSDAGKFVDVALSDIINNTLNVVSSVQPKNVTVSTELDSSCHLRCDEPQISHILMNLFVNAFQAMEDKGGCLTVSDGESGSSVWFSVADTGPGIPEEHLEKIFDPFFTTKEVGKGTGLGLAIVQQTVQQYNGTVDVKSSSEGTCFTVYFPKA